MTFDSLRGHVVLFGGAAGIDALLSDTWEWDGSGWTQKFPSPSPMARAYHQMSYDSLRRRVAVYFGQTATYDQNFNPTYDFAFDVQEWDGAAWTPREPGAHPNAQMRHGIAFDTIRRVAVLFGGFGFSRGPASATWELASDPISVQRPLTAGTDRDRTVTAGLPVTLSGSADNGGAAPIAYSWARAAISPGTGPGVVFTAPNSLVTTLTPPVPGTYNFVFTASDGRGSPVTATASVTVIAPVGVPLRHRLNIVSVPLNPSTSGHVYDAADLSKVTSATFVARTIADGRFEVYSPQLGNRPFPIEGWRGYLLHRRGPDATVAFSGREWDATSRRVSTFTGLSLLGAPIPIPLAATAESLTNASGARYLINWGDGTQPVVYFPSLSPSFPVVAGGGYGAASSRPTTFSLASGRATTSIPTGSIQGYVFRNPDGSLILGSSPTAPAGAIAVSGARITISGGTSAEPFGTTGGQGAFALFGVSAGGRMLQVSIADGTIRGFPISVFAFATTTLGPPAITRQQALAAVQAITPPTTGPEAAYLFMTQNPLPANATVAPELGGDLTDIDPSQAIRFSTPQWFAYFDPHADRKFGHRTHYLFVDSQTGATTTYERHSWPAINGGGLYRNPDDRVRSPDLINPPTLPIALRKAASSAVEKTMTMPPFDHDPGCTAPMTYALIVGGIDCSGVNKDCDSIQGLFGKQGLPPAASVSVFKTITSQTPQAVIKQRFDAICAAAQPCDTVFLYFNSHGNLNGVLQLDRCDATGSSNGSTNFGLAGPGGLDFGRCRAGHVIIIVDACYSGVITNNGKDVKKFKGLEAPGRKIVVVTAADSNHESVEYNYSSPAVYTLNKSVGAAFTNALLDGVRTIPDTSDPISEFTNAYDRARPKLEGNFVDGDQHPTIFTELVPGTSNQSGMLVVGGTSITVNHEAHVTQLPRTVGTIPLTNTSDITATVSVSLIPDPRAYTATISPLAISPGSTGQVLLQQTQDVTSAIPAFGVQISGRDGGISFPVTNLITVNPIVVSNDAYVDLDQPLGNPTQTYPASLVYLDSITGGFVGTGPHCLHNDGQPSLHLHALPGGPGISIRDPNGITYGPFADPDPEGCGYGLVYPQ
ncbi:MAG: hypothetical protein HY303_02770 [Candidatus Wallbacteria bacterium]|nr:hypothetical protein [Candidatus Wallbacteria bacterium]